MDRWRQETKDWLSSEQAAAPEEEYGTEALTDAAADTAFAQVFAALPPIEPTPDFVHRTVAVAWATRARYRRNVLLVRAAAALLLATASGVASYGIAIGAGPSLVSTAAVISSRTVLWLVSSAAATLDWWMVTARVSTSLAAIAATPDGIAALVTTQLIAAAALYILRRLLAGAAPIRTPRAFCF